jgi:hypothetical protein
VYRGCHNARKCVQHMPNVVHLLTPPAYLDTTASSFSPELYYELSYSCQSRYSRHRRTCHYLRPQNFSFIAAFFALLDGKVELNELKRV